MNPESSYLDWLLLLVQPTRSAETKLSAVKAMNAHCSTSNRRTSPHEHTFSRYGCYLSLFA